MCSPFQDESKNSLPSFNPKNSLQNRLEIAGNGLKGVLASIDAGFRKPDDAAFAQQIYERARTELEEYKKRLTNILAHSISTARHDHRKERISLAITERSGNPLLSSLLVFDEENAEGSITLLLQLLGGPDHSVFLTRRLGSPPSTLYRQSQKIISALLVFLLWGRGGGLYRTNLSIECLLPFHT
ncbi:hypothetical protein CDAR_295031 [Caerostris darwini]|uniref:Uncharacterized protein n=1 Tax=Caerostris darwini TaxID=1538125 RepID=A0AAV4UKI3_9ARAC|nr:hypothetical protein CDAR_295031 [Caerostris darwini]